jgi:arsenite methyltransferase
MAQNPDIVHEAVRDHYAAKATTDSCCGSSDCCDPLSSNLYPADMLTELPDDISSFTLGCGNPIALASLRAGETVLDLGSGGGLDCFLAAKQVGETGRVIGVDMTPEMIERARSNAERLKINNVEFRQGFLEDMPMDSSSIDVVISNCVINLTPDKFKVFAEMARVLKPGGRVGISDVVSNGPLPKALRENIQAWDECLGGALEVKEYTRGLTEAGFIDINIEPKDGGGRLLSRMPVGVPFSALITACKR